MKFKRITAALLAAVMAASSVTVNVFADSSSEEVAVYTENDTNSDDDEDIDIPIPPDDEDTDEPEEPNEPPEPPVDPDEPEDPDTPVEPFSYSVLDDGTVQITRYNGSEQSVDLPSEIDGKNVTAIGDAAFIYCSDITNVTIPDSVTSIGDWAFQYCSSLISVALPDSITSIGDYAFQFCKNLTSVIIPANITSIQYYVFNGCTSLESVVIPNSVTNIEYGAFGDCSSIKSITIPDSVKTIQGYAFQNCSSLTNIIIPDGIMDINSFTFEGCTNLTSINIPNSVTSIGDFAFNNCEKLANITMPDGLINIGEFSFQNCSSLTSVVIPSGVTTINNFAFNNCSGLTSITVPESVVSISSGIFSGCASLTSIKIPDSVTNIGDDAFKYCTSLVSIIIPDSVTNIDFGAFSGCTSLSSITIPEKVENIGKLCFAGCTSLTAINVADGNENYSSENGVLFNKDKTELKCYPAGSNNKNYSIPESVINIGENAFLDCENIIDITIPDSVVSIGEYAFNRCTRLENIVISDNVTNIDSGTFEGCSNLASITIPDGVTIIGGHAFNSCESLVNIKIPDSVTDIGYAAFYDCLNLKSITMPYGVTSIGGSAFNNCKSLEYVTIPNSVTVIGDSAFYDCSSLKSVTISYGVTNIGDSTFYNCKSIESVVIPDNVTNIEKSAFSNCTSLTSIIIPDKVKWIGSDAFYNCPLLINVEIPESVEAIDSEAFGYIEDSDSYFDRVINDIFTIYCAQDSIAATYATKNNIPYKTPCSGSHTYSDEWTIDREATIDNYGVKSHHCTICGFATNPVLLPKTYEILYESFYDEETLYVSGYRGAPSDVVIPSQIDGKLVTEIGENAFKNCTSLINITIPDSVMNIGDCAFSGCTNIEAINVDENNKVYSSANGVLFNKDMTELLYYPVCKNDKNYIVPNSITNINDYAFDGCANLESISLQNGVVDIGYGAFRGCTSLVNITIPKGVTVIRYGTFDSCTSLTNITIPNSVTWIDYNVFNNCVSLDSITIPSSVTSIGDYALGYTCNENTNWEYIKTDSLKIKCYKNTEGEQYAKDNGFEYELLECKEHEFGDWSITRVARCTEDGEKVRICSICNETETEIIPATGHKEVIDKAVAATCTKTGLTEGIHCSVCDAVIKAQEVIPATGKHSFGEWKTTKPATCTTAGTKTRSCSVCGKVETQTIAKTAHKYVNMVVKPTYAAQGYTLHKCSVCGASYKDNYTAKLTIANMSGFKAKSKSYNSITLQWNKNTSATGYELQKWNGKKWVALTKITKNSTTTYTVKSLKASATYKYRIRAYKTIGKATQYSGYKELSVNTNPSNMSGFKAKSKSYNSITLQWNKNTSATGYELQKWNGKKWVALTKITKNSTTTYTVKSLKASATYKYRIRAYKTIGKATQYSGYKELSVNTNPSNMSGFKAKSKSYNSITLQWNKNTSATGYELQKWNGKKWVALTKITKNSTTTYTVKNLKASTTYKYRIRAYKTIGKATQYSGYKELSVNTNPSNMSGFKAKSTARTSVTLQWKKNTSATGYEIQKWNGKKWVSAAKVTKNSTVTSTVKNLKKNTSYKFRIRAYKTIGKATQYSSWSGTLTVRTKK